MQKNKNRPGYKKTTLGAIADIYSGGTPSRAKREFWGGSIPWVKTANICDRTILESDIEEWITEEGLKASAAKMVPKGTILMAMYGQGKTRGRVAVLGLNATVNQACAAISLKRSANREFIFQQLLSRYSTIRQMSNSGGQDNLSAGLIREIPLYIPSLPEQKAIAEVLTCWDKAIRGYERKIEKKRNIKKGLMQRLLSGKQRLPGFDGEWKEVRLSEVLHEHGRKSTGSEEVHSVSVHKGLINQIEHLGRSFAAADTSNYNLVQPGDIVYTKSPTGDFPYGIIKQSRLSKNAIVSPLYGVFTPMTVHLGLMLDCFFESPVNTGNYLQPIIQKGAKNTINITNKTFLSNRLLLPLCPDEQKAIASVFTCLEDDIVALERKLAALRKQKRFLLNNMVTGSLRLPEFRIGN